MDNIKKDTITIKKTSIRYDYRKLNLQLYRIMDELPSFCRSFFVGIHTTTSILTRINYAYDLRVFFHYLLSNIYQNKKMELITLQDLQKLSGADIEAYMMYLSSYQKDNQIFENQALGKKRKMASLRSFFKYFYKKQLINMNPTALVDMPKVHDKAIIRLEADEIVRLLNKVELGEELTKRQKEFYQYTRLRDIAILTLLLGTGIRVSECVGLNLQDIDFSVNGISVLRKGGDQAIIYFWNEVLKALQDYLMERKQILPLSGHEDALFLSLQRRRITPRAVEQLVKKYSQIAVPLKRITPHKLRSTYGTALYRETGDIYLVADVLGHKDVNTTKKHYAAIADTQRRQAAKAVILKEDNSTSR